VQYFLASLLIDVRSEEDGEADGHVSGQRGASSCISRQSTGEESGRPRLLTPHRNIQAFCNLRADAKRQNLSPNTRYVYTYICPTTPPQPSLTPTTRLISHKHVRSTEQSLLRPCARSLLFPLPDPSPEPSLSATRRSDPHRPIRTDNADLSWASARPRARHSPRHLLRHDGPVKRRDHNITTVFPVRFLCHGSRSGSRSVPRHGMRRRRAAGTASEAEGS